MTNSQCQYFVDLAHPSHARFPNAYAIHFMDDILIACSNERELCSLYEDVMTNLLADGIQVAKEKFQMLPLYDI